MLEVLFTPADFAALAQRDLRRTTCVVFDVLRATSSMLTALANGAEAIVPVLDIPEALTVKRARPDVLLAGERDGVRILRHLTGSVDFDFGNSPREFLAEKIAGKRIVWTTTNGTRALRACAGAGSVLLGALLNLRALAERLRHEAPPDVLLVCSGTFEQTAYEDVLAAGALAQLIEEVTTDWADSAQIAREIYERGRGALDRAVALSRNARRLLARDDLAGDVEVCFRRDTLEVVAALGRDGVVRRV